MGIFSSPAWCWAAELGEESSVLPHTAMGEKFLLQCAAVNKMRMKNEQQGIEGRHSEVCEGKWKPLTEGNQEEGPERGKDLTAHLLPWVLNMPVLEDAMSYAGFAKH